MIREKLTVKTQLYLDSIPWLFVGLINLIDKFNLVSKNISMILAIITWSVLVIVLVLNLNKKEKFDESAKSILAKVDGICLQSILYIILILSIGIALISKNYIFNNSLLSTILILLAFTILFLRGILFSYYDRKGLK